MPEHTGQVFFEIAVDTVPTKDPLRDKLKQAAYNKTVLIDVKNKRKYWHFPSTPPAPDLPQLPIETDPDKMPEFIKKECLRELLPDSEAYSAEPALLGQGSLDFYCMPDETIICYHKYQLLKNGLPIMVSAVHEGVAKSTELLIVLTYATPQ